MALAMRSDFFETGERPMEPFRFFCIVVNLPRIHILTAFIESDWIENNSNFTLISIKIIMYN